ncbi:MAG: glycosyltransferase family 39 protein, partial [Solirubrobacterales bacterium]|nr:glycosyltransferase family 39 protein [Solirubrobacterales bacterium]
MGEAALQAPPRGADAAAAARPPKDRSELRVCWRALWTSRLVVFLAGVLAVLQFRPQPGSPSFDPAGLTSPFSYAGNVLAAPFARWDSVWYLIVAQHGYDHAPARTAFYPLYPLLIRVVGTVLRSDLVAGVVLSLAFFAIGLVVLHRLAQLELDREDADVCVMLLAFAPMAFFFSAVYTESLFLALSVGSIYQARRGHWRAAALLGGLASASRNTGVLLALPLVLLYLYGPRPDPVPRERSLGRAGSRHPLLARLRPKYPPRPSIAWIALVPAGLGAYIAWLALTTGNGLAPFGAERMWYRHFAWPWGGIWQGTVAAFDGLRQLVHGPPPPTYFSVAGGNALTVAGQNLMEFGFLVLGVIACIGVLRKLPFAYGAYVVVALAAVLSYPVSAQPLASLPRYEVVLFPLFMWAASWVRRRGIALQTIAVSAVLLGFFTAEFA